MRYWLSLLIVCLASMMSQADDYIVIVFDTSGSMGEYMRVAQKSRMEVAKEALKDVLANVPETTKIGILTFGGWVYEIGPADKQKIDEAIESCRPIGGTPLYYFIKQGADSLLEERQRQGNVGFYKLVVVTDGEADPGSDAPLNEPSTFKDGSFKPGVLQDVMSRGIVVDAIGLDMKTDHSLKTKINGNYMNGNSPETIKEAVAKSVIEVGVGDSKDVVDEAFREIAGLPDEFINASLEGLTSLQNHPIGEQAPVESVRQNGTATTSTVTVADNGGGSGGMACVVVSALFVIVTVLAVCIAAINSR